MEGLTQIRLVKILCLAVLLGVVIFFAANGFVAPGKGTINRPIVILGLSKISLNHTQTVGVQVDRVIRDMFIKNSPFDVRGPADRIPKNSSEVFPYAEGNRVREMMTWAGVKVLPLTPCRAKSNGDGFYFAADGRGKFPFLISPSKITY